MPNEEIIVPKESLNLETLNLGAVFGWSNVP